MGLTEDKKELIEWLYMEFSRLIWVTAATYIGETEAEDAIQELMVVLLERPETMEGRSVPELKSFLIKVTKNYCIDLLRHSETKTASYEAVLDSYGDHWQTLRGNPVDRIEEEELIALLKRTLKKLTPENRIVVEQRLRYQLSNQEIADRLHLSKRTVDKRLSRGRQEIRRVMRGVGYHV